MTNSSQGFNDDATGTEISDTSDDYDYDLDGNMTKDENKDITLIKYNHLNLPTEIQFTNNRTINYMYDATGAKLKKEVNDGTYTTVTDYLDGYQYENKHINIGGRGYTHLLFFPHAEGYVKPVYSENKTLTTRLFSYVYNHTDHLGNIRMSYAKVDGVTKVLEENNYYPFGLKHQNYNATKSKLSLKASNNEKQVTSTVENPFKYKYNGKELQDELGLNLYSMDLRMYDPAIARWNSIDPVTHYSMSTYTSFDNNPVFWADPSGADAESDYNWETGKYRSGSFQAAMANQGLNPNGSEKSECDDCNKCPETCNDKTNNNNNNNRRSTFSNEFDGGVSYGDDSSPPIVEISDKEMAGRNELFITVVTLPADIVGISSIGKWFFKRYLKSQLIKQGIKRSMITLAKNKNIYSAQPGLKKSIVEKYFKQMNNNSFNHYKELSGWVSKGKTVISGGNHRMNAAIKYAAETGNFKYVNLLIKNTRMTKVDNLKDYGIKIYNLIK